MDQQVGVDLDTSSKAMHSLVVERISDEYSPSRRDINNEDGVFDGNLQRDKKGDEVGMTNTDEICEWVDDGDEEEEDRISLGSIGRLWSERILTAFTSTIKNVWVTQYGVDVSMIGKNIYRFQFYHWHDHL